ncbi:hypothetical protein D0Z06_07270 [Geodermatophilus marinus]|nr:hypothetical protein D0Z06_07270 [Geodermatophilus sp. LHW52908]
MAVLDIALEEGFEGDSVVVEVDGRRVFERDGVRTRMQIGLADTVEVPAGDGGDVDVEVRLPSRPVTGRLRVHVTDRLHVGVSVHGDAVVFRTSPTPFGYV